MIDHAESIDGGLTSVSISKEQDHKTLLTNGKFQGNNAWKGECKHKLASPQRHYSTNSTEKRALVIGLRNRSHWARFPRCWFQICVEIAELSGDVVKQK